MHGFDAQDTLSFESCSFSMACDVEEVGSESSKKMKDMDETRSEASWTAVTQGREKEVWSLERRSRKRSQVKGVSVNPEGEAATDMYGRNWQGRKRKSGKNGKEGKWKCSP